MIFLMVIKMALHWPIAGIKAIYQWIQTIVRDVRKHADELMIIEPHWYTYYYTYFCRMNLWLWRQSNEQTLAKAVVKNIGLRFILRWIQLFSIRIVNNKFIWLFLQMKLQFGTYNTWYLEWILKFLFFCVE